MDEARARLVADDTVRDCYPPEDRYTTSANLVWQRAFKRALEMPFDLLRHSIQEDIAERIAKVDAPHIDVPPV